MIFIQNDYLLTSNAERSLPNFGFKSRNNQKLEQVKETNSN